MWEGKLAPVQRLIAVNRGDCLKGFGAGNCMVVSASDLPSLTDQTTFAGWDGILRGLLRSSVPFWFVQQSIVRELIPEGGNPQEYPGIGHTGGCGLREFLHSGLFAVANQGGHTTSIQPIAADAGPAIIVGHSGRGKPS